MDQWFSRLAYGDIFSPHFYIPVINVMVLGDI